MMGSMGTVVGEKITRMEKIKMMTENGSEKSSDDDDKQIKQALNPDII